MELQQYLDKMKDICEKFLQFIDRESDDEINDIIDYIKKQKISEDKHMVKSILHFLAQVSNHHHRNPSFFDRIEQILKNIEIKQYISNDEIFDICKSNKKLMLFLINEEILSLEFVLPLIEKNEKLKKANFPEFLSKSDNEEFNLKREIGENDNYVCQLIRKDSLQEFVTYINQANIDISSKINPSIFETNTFLLNKETSLIEYAAFFGSISIFRYLKMNNVELNSSLWKYGIHSNNVDLFYLLEEIRHDKSVDAYETSFIESVKCHHNKIADYIQSNFLGEHLKSTENIRRFFKSYNFEFISSQNIDQSSFYFICLYDHYYILDFLLKTQDIDVNFEYRIDTGSYITEDTKTALFYAVEKRNIDIIKLLCEYKNTNLEQISNNYPFK